MRLLIGLVAIVLGAGALAQVMPPARAQSTGPALELPEETLAAHLHCDTPLTNLSRDPVLLVPGTGLDGSENYEWGYQPALAAAGFASCTVDMQDAGMGDIQTSAEYVVFAIREMAQESGRKVAVIGYSQGGLEPRWALRYWPDLRALVSDFVGLAPAHHGADTAAAVCGLATGCGPSIRQMSAGSRFLQAIDNDAQVWAPVDYTVIYSLTDGVVIPPAERSSLVATPGVNVANIAVQDVCPASGLVHIGFPSDGTAFALVLDALLRPGPAEASRVSSAVCGSLATGVSAEVAAAKAEELGALATGRIFGYPPAATEPGLRAYAVADAPAASAPAPPSTGSGTAPAPASAAVLLFAVVACLAPAAAFALIRVARK